MLEVQRYLLDHGLDALCDRYAINAVRHDTIPEFVLLKYSQIDSPMGEKIVQQCRGIILDESDNWEVIARPYDKFFNYGEGHATSVNWDHATVYEKLDGSLITMYYARDEWRVATSGNPSAGGKVRPHDFTFAELFWEVWSNLGYDLPDDTSKTYMFELLTDRNRIVTKSATDRIVLHGARDILGQELSPEYYDYNGWEIVKSWDLHGWDNVLDAASNLNPMDSEGYVVVDGLFNRVKVKAPAYVALAHLKDGLSERRMIQLVLSNESSEFLTYFPEYADLYNRVYMAVNELIVDIIADFRKNNCIAEQKEFAIAISDKSYKSALFALRSGKICTAIEFLRGTKIESCERLLTPYML